MEIHEKVSRSMLALFGSSIGDLSLYALLALGVWLFFYVFFHARFRHRRVSRRGPTSGQVRREVLCSLRSIGIFGLVAGAVAFAGYSGWTQLYLRIDEYGVVWFVMSVGVMIVLHDTYFYWTHRLMHHRRLFRLFHATHHRSTSPTPWAAYAFSPLEAVVQAGIAPIIVLVIPVHPAAFALFMTWQISFNVFGHCGHEIFPNWFLRCRIGTVLNSVTHHTMHHEKYGSNFGLYFNVWDRWMGSNHLDYEKRFDTATSEPFSTSSSHLQQPY